MSKEYIAGKIKMLGYYLIESYNNLCLCYDWTVKQYLIIKCYYDSDIQVIKKYKYGAYAYKYFAYI